MNLNKIQQSLKNKQGENKKVFFLMVEYYKQNLCFFSDADSFKNLLDTDDLRLWNSINERTLNRYKNEIRKLFGTTLFDRETQITVQNHVLNIGHIFDREESLIDEIHLFLKNKNIEIPSDSECQKIANLILKKQEKKLFESIGATLTNEDKSAIKNMLNPFEEYSSFFEFLKQNQTGYHFESIEIEIKKIKLLKIIDFNKFDLDVSERSINRYVRKFLKETPAQLKIKDEKEILSISFLFLFSKYQETVDALLDHLRQLIFNGTKKGILKEKNDRLKLLHSIEDIGYLYNVAESASLNPNKVVKESIYKTVPLDKINKILKNKNEAFYKKNSSQTHASQYYKSTIRSRIFDILSVLDFKSENSDLSKIINGIKSENPNFFEEAKPFLSTPSKKFIHNTKDTNLFKAACEFEFLKVLNKKLNHKEVWITCSKKYNNPQKEVMSDFYENKDLYCDTMGLFRTGTEFTQSLQKEMSEYLTLLDANLSSNEDVVITKRNNKPWIKLSPITASPENPKLNDIKEGILQKWGVFSLIDIINEVDLRADFVKCFRSVGSWSTLSDDEIRKRIIVVIFGLGTNLGLKRVAQLASLTLEELRHIKRYYFSHDNLRDAIKKICNHMFLNYDEKSMGKLSKGLCADSTHMTSFEDNLLTQWSGKYKKSGIMIYWHLTLNYICVFSQVKNCGSSEVASMLHGFLYHGTELDGKSQYADSHGQSELGFALSRLLNFDLLPRIKDIGNQKLYIPYDMELKNIHSIIKRKINWKLISDHYDEMVQIACALKYRKTTPDSIIRQFSSSNFTSSLFKAFKELGRCQKTIFLCRYLNNKELRVEINAALNIVENWNSMMGFVRFANHIDFKTNSIDDIELNALCLHLIQLSITYINMICIQNIARQFNVTPEDKVSLVFYKHINPYGTIDVSFKKRLNIGDL